MRLTQLERWKTMFATQFDQKTEVICRESCALPKNDSFRILMSSYVDDLAKVEERIKILRDGSNQKDDVVQFRRIQIDINKIEIKLDRLDLTGWDEAVMERRRILKQLSTLAESFRYGGIVVNTQDVSSPSSSSSLKDESTSLDIAITTKTKTRTAEYKPTDGVDDDQGGLTFYVGAGGKCGDKEEKLAIRKLAADMDPPVLLTVGGSDWDKGEVSDRTVIHLLSDLSVLSSLVCPFVEPVVLVTFIDSIFLTTGQEFPINAELRMISNRYVIRKKVPILILELVCTRISHDQNRVRVTVLDYILSQLVTASTITIMTSNDRTTKNFMDQKTFGKSMMQMLKDTSHTFFTIIKSTTPINLESKPPSTWQERLIHPESLRYVVSFQILNDAYLAEATTPWVLQKYQDFMTGSLLTHSIYTTIQLHNLHNQVLQVIQSIYFNLPQFQFTQHLALWGTECCRLFEAIQKNFESVISLHNSHQVMQSEQVRGWCKVEYLQFLENSISLLATTTSASTSSNSQQNEDAQKRHEILSRAEKRLPPNFPDNWKRTVDKDFEHELMIRIAPLLTPSNRPPPGGQQHQFDSSYNSDHLIPSGSDPNGSSVDMDSVNKLIKDMDHWTAV